MRKLVFLFAIFFSLAGMSTLTQAQDEASDVAQGEALLEQNLPEGVTLETATAAQIENALRVVALNNRGDAAAIQAAANAATSSPRVANRPSAQAMARTTVAQLGALVSQNVTSAPYRTPTTIVDPEQAAVVVNNIIRNSNLSITQINQIVSDIESLSQNTVTDEEETFLQTIFNNVRADVAQTIEEESGGNQNCTTSNDVVTCVPA